MRTGRQLAALAALVAGCARPLPCAIYEDEPALVEACGAVLAPLTNRIDDADVACNSLAAGAQGACHAAWARSHAVNVDRHTRARLVDWCGDDADCAFAVLDSSPSADVAEQIKLCRDHAGKYADDCVGHAAQRFSQSMPSPAVCEAVRPVNDRVAGSGDLLIGKAIGCGAPCACPEGSSACAAGLQWVQSHTGWCSYR